MKKILYWAAVLLIMVFLLFPLLWGLRLSLAPRFDTKFLPNALTLEHYESILSRREFLTYFLNSALVATITVLITLILSLFGSYALARFNFPGKNFGIVFLVFPLLPPAAILVPLVSYVNRLGLYDTLAAVILINMVFNLPFAVWMLRNFVLTNPIEVEEAAYLDGCSHVAVLWRIAIPSMAPGLIAVAVFVFINSWNNYLYAFALTASQSLRVLPQGIFAFLGTWGTYWGGLSAAGILTLIPPVAMFLVFHKWFIAGLLGAQLR